MKKWYQSAFCKGMLILITHITAVVTAICILVALAYPGQNYEDLFTSNQKIAYEETVGFGQAVCEDMIEILDMIRTEKMLGADGNVDLNQVVDLSAYSFFEENKPAENPGEFSFKLGDLLETGDTEEEIIVCKKPKGELQYQYFTPHEFVKFVKENGYKFEEEGEDAGEREQDFRDISEGYYTPDCVLDKENNIIFEQTWDFGESVDISIKTAEGKTILEMANTSAKWNGKLEELCQMFGEKRSELIDTYENYEQQEESYKEGNTNLSYLFVNYDQKTVRTNRKEYQSFENAAESMRKMKENGKYIVSAGTLAECDTNLSAEQVSFSEVKHYIETTAGKDKAVFVVSVDTKYPIHDSYVIQNQAYDKYRPLMSKAIGIGITSLIVLFICLIWLTVIAGHSNQEDGLILMFFDKWKTEIGLCLIGALLFGAGGILVLWIEEALPWNWTTGHLDNIMTAPIILGTAALTFCAWALFLIAYLSLVRRIKARTLWKNSILKWFVHTISFIFQNRSCVTKGIIAGVVLFLINLFLASNNGGFIAFAVFADIFAMIVMVKRQIEKESIKKGIARIAGGDVQYQIPLEKLSKDNAVIAENVNHIGEGIQNAVEKSLKDERLKTDLITNVSHDIKTPLTSIINYVGLLKQEKFDDPKIQKYLDILDEKSQRLKTLTEDVVEASKISSGNINLNVVQLDLVEMIHQTTGEFAEKFENKDLKMVMNLPEEPVMIKADGRRMWRVIENIYNNAAKYAMPGTRIYADMKADGKEVQFSLKNISENPLNITADELTERFIRGDVSRSTEGSGLGLSIAQNLTKMQGGEFKVYVDGDLFKVTIVFSQTK